MSDSRSVTVRLDYGVILFLIFLVLKLTGVLGWSWWWVTAPLWLPLAVFGAVFGGLVIAAAVLGRK